jgi:hypothetical protein
VKYRGETSGKEASNMNDRHDCPHRGVCCTVRGPGQHPRGDLRLGVSELRKRFCSRLGFRSRAPHLVQRKFFKAMSQNPDDGLIMLHKARMIRNQGSRHLQGYNGVFVGSETVSLCKAHRLRFRMSFARHLVCA